MKSGRKKVWSALKGKPSGSPPKGEILITDSLINQFNQPDLEFVLSNLNADLVTFSLSENQDSSLWKEWSDKPYFVFGLFQGPFTLTAEKLGWDNMFYLIVKKPKEAMALMKNLMEETLGTAAAALANGCDGILVADDLAGNQGLIASPLFFKENYFPLLADLLKKLNCTEVPLLFHSDGKIIDLVQPLKEAGFWGIQGLQPSCGIGPDCFSRDSFQNWVFWGNFEFEGPGRLKTVPEVISDVHHVLDIWADFPGFIFGSSGGLYGDLSPQAVKIAYDIVNRKNPFLPD